jgi:hypothetical protein
MLPILRYRLRIPALETATTLDAYGSTNTVSVPSPGPAPFNSCPDTWGQLDTFEEFTELDARLTLKLKTRAEAEDFERAVVESTGAKMCWMIGRTTRAAYPLSGRMSSFLRA